MQNEMVFFSCISNSRAYHDFLRLYDIIYNLCFVIEHKYLFFVHLLTKCLCILVPAPYWQFAPIFCSGAENALLWWYLGQLFYYNEEKAP